MKFDKCSACRDTYSEDDLDVCAGCGSPLCFKCGKMELGEVRCPKCADKRAVALMDDDVSAESLFDGPR